MNRADGYGILGLQAGASLADIKTAYRRLAREYHPDLNPDDPEAEEKFRRLVEAYELLTSPEADRTQVSQPQPTPDIRVEVRPAAPPDNLSLADRQLKQDSYQRLQQLLRQRAFPRAVVLTESLAQRLPQDPDVRQWQAITYHRLGRHLVGQGQLEKARLYLKKALRTDPHNRTLWAEVEQDFRRLERLT